MDAFLLDPLRLSLLAVGLVVVVGVYWFSIRSARRRAAEDASEAPGQNEFRSSGFVGDADLEPLYPEDGLTYDGEPVMAMDNEFAPMDLQAPADEGGAGRPLRFVVLHVVAADGQQFYGGSVIEALTDAGLAYGDHRIYHYPALRGEGGNPLFSVANMVEPGYLDVVADAEFTTPGLSFFMRVPGPDEGRKAFTTMLQAARAIAARLGGVVKDESLSPLTSERAEAIQRQALAPRAHPAVDTQAAPVE